MLDIIANSLYATWKCRHFDEAMQEICGIRNFLIYSGQDTEETKDMLRMLWDVACVRSFNG